MGLILNQLPDSNQQPATAIQPPSDHLRFGPFRLDLRRQELFRDEAPVKIQGKVYQALVVLLESPGVVVTREALRLRLWPDATELNFDANINTTLNKLRHTFGDSHEVPVFVETIPRKGYSFVAKVEHIDPPPTSPAGPRPQMSSGSGNTQSASGHKPFFSPQQSRLLLTVGVIALVVAGVLFGAAAVLYAHRLI